MADQPLDPEAYIYDEAMERGADLMRVESFIAAESLRRWRPYRERLAEATEKALRGIQSRGEGTIDTKAFQRLADRQAKILDSGLKSVSDWFRPNLRDLAKREFRWVIETTGTALPTIRFDRISPQTSAKVWNQRPISRVGMRPPEWYQQVGLGVRRNILHAIRLGIVEGQNVSQIMQRMRSTTGGVLQVADRQLETYVRTNVQHVSQSVRRRTFEEINRESKDQLGVPVFDREYWVATLDSRTCPACASLDQQEWESGRGPWPPAHPRCRCNRLPRIRGASAGTRAARDGPVKGDTSYSDWLRRQPAETQKRVLGPTRAKLFSDGKLGDLKPELLVDANNRPLPVSALLTKLDRQQ